MTHMAHVGLFCTCKGGHFLPSRQLAPCILCVESSCVLAVILGQLHRRTGLCDHNTQGGPVKRLEEFITTY
jgi:hypothetical protein